MMEERASLVAQKVKESACNAADPLKKKMATHSNILAWEKSHGQKSLAGYGPWGHKEWDTTE